MNASPSGRTAFREPAHKRHSWKVNTSSSGALDTVDYNFPRRYNHLNISPGSFGPATDVWTLAGPFIVAFIIMCSLLSRKQKYQAPWAPETTEKLKIALLENDVTVGMCWDEGLLGPMDREKFVFGGRVTLTLTAAQQNFVLWGDEEVLDNRQVSIWIHPVPGKVSFARDGWNDEEMPVDEVLPPPSTVSPSDGSHDWTTNLVEDVSIDPPRAKTQPPAVGRYQSFDSSIATSTVHTNLSLSASRISSATSQASYTPLPSPMEKLKIRIPILTDSPTRSSTPSPAASTSSFNSAYVHPDEGELEIRPSWKRAREDAVPATPFTGSPYPAIDDAPYAPAEPSLGQRQNWGGLTAGHGEEYVRRVMKEAYRKFEQRMGYELLKGGLDRWDAGYQDWPAFDEESAARRNRPNGKEEMIFSDMPLYEEPESM